MLSLDNYKTMDPNMLLSFINTLLRDEFDSLEELCKVHDLSQQVLVDRLKTAGYEYIKEQNQFR